MRSGPGSSGVGPDRASTLFGPPKGKGPIRSLSSVCMSVCMSVTKINLVNFLKIGSYDFFKTWHKERGHQYLSNGEGSMSIDAQGAPFWALFRPKFAQNRHFVNFLENGSYDFF